MNWDILHTRFATSIRDSVSVASADGDELSVSDRDGYLMYAYTKYIRLLCLYNPLAVNNILSELHKIAAVVATSGVIPLPSDFGFFIDLQPVSFPGAVVDRLDPEVFLKMKSTLTHQSSPNTTTDIYISLSGTDIQVLPSTISGTFNLSYIVKPENIVQGGADDILIQSEHWDTVLQLARGQYHRDKHEFEVAQALENDAIINAPYKIGEAKQ